MKTADSPVMQDSSQGRSEFSRKSVLAAIGCWIGFLLGPNVMIAASNSNFLAAWIEEFGDPEAISAALAMAPLTVAIMLPISGKLMDRFGVRAVILPGILVFASAFFLMSQIINVWQFALVQIFLSIGSALNSSVGYAKVVSTWFDKHRGIVLGSCVAFGAGVGQTTMPKISQWLIESYGWRGGLQGFTLMILCVSLPIVFLLVRPRVLAAGACSAPPTAHLNKAELTGQTVREALRNPSFYKVFFAIMFGSMSLLGTIIFSRPILADKGFSVDWATTAASVAFAGVLLGEFTSGFLLDRFTTPRIVLIYFSIAWLGVLTMHSLSGDSTSLLLLGSIMLGMGFGGEVGMNAYMISRYCGLKSFGTLYGFTFAASNLGIAIGIFTCGKVIAAFGSYDNLLYIFGTTMSISEACIASLPKFVYLPEK